MNETLSWIMFGLVGAGWVAYGNNPPDKAVAPVGVFPSVTVVNATSDSVPVGAMAPQVDRVIRMLGWVPAHDSATFRLPYADTVVLLLAGSAWLPVNVGDHTTHRIQVREREFPTDARSER